ncbi:hypothetical protein PGQ11_007716 [Apiospora arundinis]|uniref:Uncharacterized protein n=1 Tax=Apiospora arundinis TaxID=335852 RepID=A0ABR2IXH4_9PEZI
MNYYQKTRSLGRPIDIGSPDVVPLEVGIDVGQPRLYFIKVRQLGERTAYRGRAAPFHRTEDASGFIIRGSYHRAEACDFGK